MCCVVSESVALQWRVPLLAFDSRPILLIGVSADDAEQCHMYYLSHHNHALVHTINWTDGHPLHPALFCMQADAATGALSASLEPAPPVGPKQHYAALLVDSVESASRLARLADAATAAEALSLDGGAGAAGFAPEAVGIVICSTGALAETTEALKAAGADLSAVDALIVNAGTEIWHRCAPRYEVLGTRCASYLSADCSRIITTMRMEVFRLDYYDLLASGCKRFVPGSWLTPFSHALFPLHAGAARTAPPPAAAPSCGGLTTKSTSGTSAGGGRSWRHSGCWHR